MWKDSPRNTHLQAGLSSGHHGLSLPSEFIPAPSEEEDEFQLRGKRNGSLLFVSLVNPLLLGWRDGEAWLAQSSVSPHTVVGILPQGLYGCPLCSLCLHKSYPSLLTSNPGKIKYETLEKWILPLKSMHTPKITYYRTLCTPQHQISLCSGSLVRLFTKSHYCSVIFDKKSISSECQNKTASSICVKIKEIGWVGGER